MSRFARCLVAGVAGLLVLAGSATAAEPAPGPAVLFAGSGPAWA